MKTPFRPDTPPVTWRERLITLALIALMLIGLMLCVEWGILGLLASGGP